MARIALVAVIIVLVVTFNNVHVPQYTREVSIYPTLDKLFDALYRSILHTKAFYVMPFIAYKRRNSTFLEYMSMPKYPALSVLYYYYITKNPEARDILRGYAHLINESISRYGFIVPLDLLNSDGSLKDGIAITTYCRSLDAFLAIELSHLGMLSEDIVAEGIISYYKFIGFYNYTHFLNEGIIVKDGTMKPYTLKIIDEDLPRQHAQVLRPLLWAISKGQKEGYDVLNEAIDSIFDYVSQLGFIKYRPNDDYFFEMYSSKYILNWLLAYEYLGKSTERPLMIGLYQSVSGHDGYPLLWRRTVVNTPEDIRIILPNIHGIKVYPNYRFRAETPQYRSSVAALNALYVPLMLYASHKYVELSAFYTFYVQKIYDTSVYGGMYYTMYDERAYPKRQITSELYGPAYLVDLLYERVTAGYSKYILDIPYFNPGFRSYVIPDNDTLVIPFLKTGLIKFNVPVENIRAYHSSLLYWSYKYAYVVGDNVTIYVKIGKPASLHLLYKASGDSDRDGITDLMEIKKGTDPFSKDTDGDGLIDSLDPNPSSADGDRDSLLDGFEFMFGTDPNNPHSLGKYNDYVYTFYWIREIFEGRMVRLGDWPSPPGYGSRGNRPEQRR